MRFAADGFRVIACWLAVNVAAVGGEPQVERPAGRLVESRGEITIEYSPGQEAYVAPLADALEAWRAEIAARRAAGADVPPPMSASDLMARREAFLRDVAQAIGLDAPSALQGACFDTFVNYYAALTSIRDSAREMAWMLADAPHVAIWQRSELVERLKGGEAISGFRYDAAADEVEYSWNIQVQGDDAKKAAQAMEANRLDHAFHYRVEDGVARFSGSFTFKPGEERTASRFDLEAMQRRMAEAFGGLRLVIPVRIEKDGAPLTPEEVVAAELASRRQALRSALAPPYRDGALALVVLHETAEIGLIERYIGSADRRWFCDGTANYVAWSVARRHAGEAFARDVYDLPAQLARHAASQPKIRLRRWKAVERQSEAERAAPLDEAHYPFATRAVRRMAERHGEDIVARVWREVGKTPRPKVSMRTVERAYRKLTGERLSAVIRAAERDPIEPKPTPEAPRSSDRMTFQVTSAATGVIAGGAGPPRTHPPATPCRSYPPTNCSRPMTRS